MTDALPSPRRRGMLAMLAALPAARAWAAPPPSPQVMVDEATLLVAGPDGGALDRWGRVVLPALSQALPPDMTLTRGNVGGSDGVTGANQFATRGEPDGRTILLAPGEAAIAWLVGDPRAKYDLGRWTAVMVGTAPAVLVLRRGLDLKRKPVRFAVPALASTALAGVLALELMGGRAEPVAAIGTDQQATAFAAGGVDAVLARGPRLADQLATLAGTGGAPALVVTPSRTRDPGFPDLPVSGEILTGAAALLAAHLATAAAARLEFALVLPQLTPATRVAVWRHAAAEAAQTLDLQSYAMAVGARAIAGADANAEAAPTVASPEALKTLRAWLADRFKFKPA